MKRILSSVAIAAAVALAAGSAQAENLTIVSWGGAYTASQQKATTNPTWRRTPT